MKKIINTANAPKPIGPYSQANFINGTLYISGQVPVNSFTGEVVKGDIKIQTRQVMENLKAILHEAQMDFSYVVKASIFITDMTDFPQINEVYGSYFADNPPARECVQVTKLPLNVDVEISMIAVES